MTGSTTGKTDPNVDMSSWRIQVQKRRVKFDDDQKAIYCEHLSRHGLKTLAALQAQVAYSTVLAHLKNDPDFAQAVDEAWAIRAGDIVLPLEKQGLEGHEEKTIHGEGDNKVERVRRVFETPIRMSMLKKYDKDGYADKAGMDLSGMGGSIVLMVPQVLTKEEWIAAYSPKEAPPPIEEEVD